MPREEELLTQAGQGDKEAFTELFQALHKRIYFYLLHLLGDENRAEEVTAETFAEVWRCASRFEGRSKASTWIMGIARNIAYKQMQRWRNDHDDLEEHYELSDAGSQRFVAMLERQDLLKKGLAALSPKHREVLILAFYEELSYEEISKMLGIPVNTVKTRVFHAKKALRLILSSM